MARLLLSAACLLFFVSGTPHRIPTTWHRYSTNVRSPKVVRFPSVQHLWIPSIVTPQGNSDPYYLSVRGENWFYVAHAVLESNVSHSRLVHAGPVSYEFSAVASPCDFLAHTGVQCMPAHMGVEFALLGGTDVVDDVNEVQRLRRIVPSCIFWVLYAPCFVCLRWPRCVGLDRLFMHLVPSRQSSPFPSQLA
ncbi:hypothetical protein EDD18DRAFT_1114650 [Armillaria luteobubalina]|uniref:Uncharacterized protein n=1 Tax=Armillaria luteobubalina TaxID=153913 RepID=A0AA39P559_9AGAR|nr:hypothetical protein EDD18DRAFT_1114650 [Armillaria luteobubalina]